MPSSDTSPGTIGCVGLGDMGAPIAANYARHGLTVLAHDLRPALEDDVVSWGAQWVARSADLVTGVDVLCICLLNDKQVRAFVRDERVFELMHPGGTVVVHSTVSPKLVIELTELGRAQGIHVVDAPVSGTQALSHAGRLTVMVATEPAIFDALRPLWAAIGETVIRVADTPGSAQVIKLCNNMMAEANYLVALEALRIAQAHDISEGTFLEVVTASSGNSWMTENWDHPRRHMLTHPEGGPDAKFAILLKDLQIAVQIATEAGIVPLVSAVAGVAGEQLLAHRFAQIAAET
jgi:3-hydroxyisobutyrate dehydrogenase-like beta-hydroxyacid dehydrogenase